MRIDFFEEYPTRENLAKLKRVRFPTTVYLAATSIKEFHRLRKDVEASHRKAEAAYWPILKGSYWVSPLSPPAELRRLRDELESRDKTEPLKVMLDLELPLPRDISLPNMFSFFRNKKRIRKLLDDAPRLNVTFLTAEYRTRSEKERRKWELLGVSYPPRRHPTTPIVMLYTSMVKDATRLNEVRTHLAKRAREREKLQFGLGTIARGAMGDEPLLSARELDRDLAYCEEHGIGTAVIFRLGGLNEGYLKVLRKHAKK